MKKHLIKSLAFCILGLGASNLSAQYCTAVGASSTADSNVETAALTGDAATAINYTGCTGTTGVTGLDDQTATQSVSVTAGNAYTANIQFGTCNGNYAGAGEAWIDWNQNDAFDPSESIGTWSGTPPVTMSAFNFTVPASAFNGTTRMRVVQQEGGSNPINPCGTFTYGSTTDFSVVVSGGVTITCASPSTLMATNIAPTSADLGWTENGTAMAWEVSYGAPGTPAGSGVSMLAATNPTTATSLMPNSPYQFYVRAICGVGDTSAWVGPFAFATPCNAFTAPYSEAFATNALPSCWNEMGSTTWEYGSSASTPTGFAAYGAANVPDHTIGGGGTFIGIDGSDHSDGEMASLMSPLVDITPLANPQLSYWVFSNNINDAAQNKLIVEFYDGANWTVVDSIQANLGSAWVEFTTDLSTFTVTGNTQVRFTITGVANGGSTFNNDILIDDVSFREAPNCLAPSALTTANITATSADLGWTENGTAPTWAVEYGASGFAPGSGTMMLAATNPLNVTGLMANTTYQFYVRAICGVGDSSMWAGPFAFTTPCAVYTPAYTTDFATFLPACWDEADAGNPTTGPTGLGTGSWGQSGTSARINIYSDFLSDWLLSPSFDLSAGGWELAINANATDYSPTTAFSGMGTDDTVQVLISTNGGTTWTPIYTWDASNPLTFAPGEITVDLSAYTGTSNMFGIWGSSGATNDPEDFYAYINSFEIRVPLSCPAPNALTATNITGTSADLGWTENGSALTWAIEYGASGFAPGSGTMMLAATNPINVTGLMPATNYEFYVRAICGVGDSSMWAGPFAFATPCPAAFTPAYMTDFSTFMPNCWDEANDGSPATGPTGLGAGSWGQSGTSARINIYSDFLSDWLLSPSFDLSTGAWELAIDANATDFSPTTAFSGMGTDDTVQVLISTNGGTTWTPIYTWDAANPFTFAASEITIDLSAYTGTSNMFGIWASDGATNDPEDFYAYINSFEIRALPAQPNLVITEIMYNPPESGVDSLEFVEIYNNSLLPLDVTGYTLSGIAYTFPAVTLPPNGYYVVGVNASAFNTVYGFAADGIATGGLSNGGEAIIIRNPMGMVVDSVRYDDNTPWPSGFAAGQPDGGGASIILCDTASNNADGNNWNACATNTGMMINGFAVLASPGAGNNCPAPIDVAVTGFHNLDSMYCNVLTITGGVIITNMSATDATNVPYSITANGTPIGGGTILSLAAMTSDTITVGPIPATTGLANIVAMTSFVGDVNPSNDMLSMMVAVSNTSATASTVNDVSCNGGMDGAAMATATDGIGAYTYMWNGDANLVNDTLMNIGAGMHTVVVMDSIGCTDTAMVTLTEPTAIVLTDSVDNVLCKGDTTGMAMVMATGGTPGYTYAWSNMTITDAITNVMAGSYTVTVTDANGCMETLTSTITEPTVALSVAITDNGDGTAYATPTGGTAGYTYLWDAAAGNQTTDTATALVNNGTYMVTVTDANGCTDTASVVITIVGTNNIANLSSLNLFPNPTNANVFVALELVENADVQINITNSIGQLVVSKELTNVQSETVELNTSALASGVYMVQFTFGTELVTRKLMINK